MGLFDKEDVFLTQERDKLTKQFVTGADYRTTDNPFRMLGGALKSYNLTNSPEAKQRRETEAIMGKYGDLISSADPMEQKQGWISIAQEVGAIGNQKGAFQAMQQANSFKAIEPKDPLIREFIEKDKKVTKQFDRAKKEWNVLSSGPRWEEKEPKSKDKKLYELTMQEDGDYRYVQGNARMVGDPNTIHKDPNKIWHTSVKVSGGDVNIANQMFESGVPSKSEVQISNFIPFLEESDLYDLEGDEAKIAGLLSTGLQKDLIKQTKLSGTEAKVVLETMLKYQNKENPKFGRYEIDDLGYNSFDKNAFQHDSIKVLNTYKKVNADPALMAQVQAFADQNNKSFAETLTLLVLQGQL